MVENMSYINYSETCNVRWNVCEVINFVKGVQSSGILEFYLKNKHKKEWI